MVCMSNKSILLSLVACVELSYYISVTISPIILLKNLCGDVGLPRNIKQAKSYFIGAANGVRLQRYSGSDTGVTVIPGFGMLYVSATLSLFWDDLPTNCFNSALWYSDNQTFR